MKIMILVRSYPPVMTSAARLYSELSESLGSMGHDVTVITAHPAEDDILLENCRCYHTKSSQKLNGINVLRVPSMAFLSRLPGGKPFRFIFSCLLFAVRGLFSTPDVILVYSPPLYMGIAGYIIGKIKKTRFVFNLQDIHPKVVIETGVIKNHIFKKMLYRMEEICYKKAFSFIVYSSGNRDYLLGKGIDKDVFIIPNWIDDHVMDSSAGMHPIRNHKNLKDKFIISYAGSMQEAQGLDIIVEAAELFKENNDIIFILAGDGSSKPILNNLIIEKNLNNVVMLPLMPKEQYIQLLHASDVCVVTLSPDVPFQTVPGKLPEIMACGQPVIAAVNRQGDAAGIIKQADCGFSVYPGDVKAFAQAVLRLYQDEKLRQGMGKKGMAFAAQNFSRTACTKMFEEVLYVCQQKSSL